MSGCPVCGSHRLARAPFTAVNVVTAPFSSKRRYQCANCDWVGWKHRLRRAAADKGKRRRRDRKAVAFAIGALVFLLVATLFLMRNIDRSGGAHETGSRVPADRTSNLHV